MFNIFKNTPKQLKPIFWTDGYLHSIEHQKEKSIIIIRYESPWNDFANIKFIDCMEVDILDSNIEHIELGEVKSKFKNNVYTSTFTDKEKKVILKLKYKDAEVAWD